ncbi:DUF6916 family protein [Nitrolancea hollandica]|nr:hypothetical protein [Nitrolancea hollandica]
MLESCTVESFTRHLGERFRVYAGQDEPFEIELIQASGLGRESTDSTSGHGSRSAFSLLFRGPAGILLPQRIYRLEHAEMGTFDLFLVPVGPDQSGQRYEAIFT